MCGIVGIYNHKDAARYVCLCLHGLQHRGQESAGIVTSDGKAFHQHREMGFVSEIFTQNVLNNLSGNNAIGHVRYSTSGESSLKNAYPFVIKYAHGWLAVAHNGNLTNYKKMRNQLEQEGSIFQATVDSEVVMQLLAKGREPSLEKRLAEALKKVMGSYSFVFLTETRILAARDPKGIRPLVIGKLGSLDDNKGYVIVSETCALDLIGAKFIREVEPGEIVVLDQDGMHSIKPFEAEERKAHCIFEHVYFARPDSNIFGNNVHTVRLGLGRKLAQEHPVDADIVIPIPDSGLSAAIGYSQESKIPLQLGLVRNHYVGRSFIEPEEKIRHFKVRLKWNTISKVLKGKRIVCVDDSIVRGTTIMRIVDMMKEAGASEVHMRIASPPITWPCFYGINTPTREELIANSKSVDEICKFIGADSLQYLSKESLYWFTKSKRNDGYCDACFTGKYPVKLDDAPEIWELAHG